MALADTLHPLAPLAAIPDTGHLFAYRDGPVEERGILVRTAAGPRAWRNQCRHLAVPLDGGVSGAVFDRERRFLVCSAHGARYRPEDGRCVAGPCEGSTLRALPVEVHDGVVYLDTSGLGGFFR